MQGAKSRIPSSVDLSLLEFLEYGDLALIAKQDRERNNRKTDRKYVWRVIHGHTKNIRILGLALEMAVKRRAKLPMQALKNLDNAPA